MATMSIFTKKKPEDQLSKAPIQGSGYSSVFASNPSTYKSSTKPAVTASQYSTKNYLSSLTKQPQFPTTSKQQQTKVSKPTTQMPKMSDYSTQNYLSKMFQTPKFPTASKPSGPISTPRSTGQMSVAPKGPQMSIDPNYKKPSPITKVELPQEQGFSMMDFLLKSADKRSNLAQDTLTDKERFIKEKYNLANEQLKGSLPIAQERFGQFEDDTEAMIADLIAGGEREKSQTEDYYGDVQRQAAQTRRETQGQTQRTFANLGTIDSYGEGSFKQATENADSDFNRFTQQTLRAKADKLAEIETAVITGERQARQVILQERQKLEDLAREIEFAVKNNDINKAEELTNAYNETVNYIYEIEDNLAMAQYQFAVSQQELQDELAKMQSLGPEFMATGNPTNQAEYEFFIKNQPAMKELYPDMFGGATAKPIKQTEKQMAYTAAANIAQNALTKLNSGNIQTGIGSGFAGSIGEKLGTNSAEQQAYRSDIASLRTTIQNALLGANMSPKEMEQIMAAIPQFNDAPDIARSKLQSLITNLPIMAGNGQQVSQPLDQEYINQIISSLGV